MIRIIIFFNISPHGSFEPAEAEVICRFVYIWSGEFDVAKNESAPLHALLFIHQGTSNEIIRLEPSEALKQLNSLGYGSGREDRRLNIVFNPRGAFFSPEQQGLEAEFKREFEERHKVFFDRLFTFTNMPVGRFRKFLESSAQLAAYERRLRESFNPATLEGIMCRTLISVAPDGRLFDCDFNQAALMGLMEGLPQEISEFDPDALANRPIAVSEHCFGCTAGSGST